MSNPPVPPGQAHTKICPFCKMTNVPAAAIRCPHCAGDIGQHELLNSKVCFVATALYGNEDHPDVEALRNFRDSVLLKSAIGRSITRTYYLWVHRSCLRCVGLLCFAGSCTASSSARWRNMRGVGAAAPNFTLKLPRPGSGPPAEPAASLKSWRAARPLTCAHRAATPRTLHRSRRANVTTRNRPRSLAVRWRMAHRRAFVLHQPSAI